MKIEIKPGKYVLGVSGGVDSMVLLDILRSQPKVGLIVAHFNHGIRPEAAEDEQLVAKVAKAHKLKLEIGQAKLGPHASEDTARKARYAFLDNVKKKYAAKAIITAHHQDDLIETAILNMLRGTGSRGLISIASNNQVVRPMLHIPKKEVISYAREHSLKWREDRTNNDLKHTRNYVRYHVTDGLKPGQRQKLLKNIDKVAKMETEKQELIATISQTLERDGQINRQAFINLPSEVANEMLLYWLRRAKVNQPDKVLIQRLSNAIKTARPKTTHSVKQNVKLAVTRQNVHLVTTVPKRLL